MEKERELIKKGPIKMQVEARGVLPAEIVLWHGAELVHSASDQLAFSPDFLVCNNVGILKSDLIWSNCAVEYKSAFDKYIKW